MNVFHNDVRYIIKNNKVVAAPLRVPNVKDLLSLTMDDCNPIDLNKLSKSCRKLISR